MRPVDYSTLANNYNSVCFLNCSRIFSIVRNTTTSSWAKILHNRKYSRIALLLECCTWLEMPWQTVHNKPVCCLVEKQSFSKYKLVFFILSRCWRKISQLIDILELYNTVKINNPMNINKTVIVALNVE